jgi:ribonuclease HII
VTVADPTLRVERKLHREGAEFVIGCDEVGRGAIAGPVAVGLSLVDQRIRRIPVGLRDSKMLSEPRREELAPVARKWVRYWAVGLASAAEIDQLGIMACLTLAGRRAMTELVSAGAPVEAAVVLLDGNHDWLTRGMHEVEHLQAVPRVQTRIKADRDCASVSAASVIAKVHRDRIMIQADDVHPGYWWKSNKGYASAEHYDAIHSIGPSEMHRHTWLHKPAPTLWDEDEFFVD